MAAPGVAAAHLRGAQHVHALDGRLPGFALQGVAHHRQRREVPAQVRDQALAGRIVQVDDGGAQLRPFEELDLGRLVALHVAMEVEVVAGQVGEDRDVEVHAGGAFLHQADGRDFDGQRARSLPAQVGEGLRQQHRVRRGVAGGVERRLGFSLHQADTQGADDGGGLAETRQRLGGPHRDRGLAVGAGDAHGEHAAVGLFEHGVGDRAGMLLQFRHAAVGHAMRRIPRVVLVVVDHGGGAGGDRRADEVPPIGGIARIGEEHVARLHPARVGNENAALGGGADPRDDVVQVKRHLCSPQRALLE